MSKIPNEYHKLEAYNCLNDEEFALLRETYEEGDSLPCDCQDCAEYIISSERRCNCADRRCYLVYNKHLAPGLRKEFPFSVEVY